MASVFKRGGKTNRRGYWYFTWIDHQGMRHTKCAKTTDRATAERIAAKHESDSALRRDGVIDVADDRYAAQARRLVLEHLDDYQTALRGKGKEHSKGKTKLSISCMYSAVSCCGAS